MLIIIRPPYQNNICIQNWHYSQGSTHGFGTSLPAPKLIQAPELLVGENVFVPNEKTDIWQLGVSISSLFVSNKNLFWDEILYEQDSIECIQKTFGFNATSLFIKSLIQQGILGELEEEGLESLEYNQKGIKEHLMESQEICEYLDKSKSLVGLIELMLELDPKHRPTAEDLLKHPYFSQYE